MKQALSALKAEDYTDHTIVPADQESPITLETDPGIKHKIPQDLEVSWNTYISNQRKINRASSFLDT